MPPSRGEGSANRVKNKINLSMLFENMTGGMKNLPVVLFNKSIRNLKNTYVFRKNI